MHIYIHTYIHACMHACMHAYVHTYVPSKKCTADVRSSAKKLKFDRAVRLPVRLPKNSDFTQPFVCQKNGIRWSRWSARSSAQKLRFYGVIRLSVRPPKNSHFAEPFASPFFAPKKSVKLGGFFLNSGWPPLTKFL